MGYGETYSVQVTLARDAGNFSGIRRGGENDFFRLRGAEFSAPCRFGSLARLEDTDYISAGRVRNNGDYTRETAGQSESAADIVGRDNGFATCADAAYGAFKLNTVGRIGGPET